MLLTAFLSMLMGEDECTGPDVQRSWLHVTR